MRSLAVLVVLATACAPGARNQTATEAVEVGQEAVDGQFTFVVEAFECGHTEVVNGLFRQEPNGEFCLLDLAITNTGEAGRTFFSGAQRLVSYDGGLLTPSSEATLVVSPGTVNEELNPGLSVETTVVFDVSDPDDIEFAQLKDGPLSQGARVRLGQERG